MTLTSDVTLPLDIADSKQVQRWLDDLPLPKKMNLDVRFESLDVGAHYFTKLTLSVNKESLESLGTHVRSTAVENGDMAAATSWAKHTWAPHISLMYADIEVPTKRRQEILRMVIEAGIRIGKEDGLPKDGKSDYSGWNGGRIALVETWKEPREWEVIASRAI